MSLKIEVLTGIDEIKTLQTTWATTLASSPADFIFLTYEWVDTWLRHYGEQGELRVFVIREEGSDSVLGIAPWIIRSREGFRRLATIAQETSDYEDIILAEHTNPVQAIAILFERVMHCSDWDIIQFHRLAPDTGTLGALFHVLEQQRIDWDCRLAEVSPYIYTDGQSWDAYWASLPKNFRANIERRQRKLCRECRDIRFSEPATHEEIQQALGYLFDLHQKRRKHISGERGLFASSRTQAFYRDLAAVMYAAGWLRMPQLHIDNHLAAIQLNFHYGKTYYKKLPAFDMAFSQYGVGDLLNVHVLRQAFDGDVTCFDFLRGNEPYKFKFMPAIRPLFSVTVFAPTARGWLARQWFDRVRPTIGRNQIARTLMRRLRDNLYRHA
ncbi:MAG: glycosyl transferase [Litorilinea sp.]|nr:MAG: glycosyl transferase [Litorilinea sp.]